MPLKRNRVNKTKLFEIGWLAGILDGEGCISIRPNGKSWAYEINITNTSKKIILRCSKILNDLEVDHIFKETKQSHVNKNWNNRCNVRIIRRRAIQVLLSAVYDLLTEKREKAYLLAELVNEKEKRPHGQHYYTAYEKKLIDKFRALQRKPYMRRL